MHEIVEQRRHIKCCFYIYFTLPELKDLLKYSSDVSKFFNLHKFYGFDKNQHSIIGNMWSKATCNASGGILQQENCAKRDENAKVVAGQSVLFTCLVSQTHHVIFTVTFQRQNVDSCMDASEGNSQEKLSSSYIGLWPCYLWQRSLHCRRSIKETKQLLVQKHPLFFPPTTLCPN